MQHQTEKERREIHLTDIQIFKKTKAILASLPGNRLTLWQITGSYKVQKHLVETASITV